MADINGISTIASAISNEHDAGGNDKVQNNINDGSVKVTSETEADKPAILTEEKNNGTIHNESKDNTVNLPNILEPKENQDDLQEPKVKGTPNNYLSTQSTSLEDSLSNEESFSKKETVISKENEEPSTEINASPVALALKEGQVISSRLLVSQQTDTNIDEAVIVGNARAIENQANSNNLASLNSQNQQLSDKEEEKQRPLQVPPTNSTQHPKLTYEPLISSSYSQSMKNESIKGKNLMPSIDKLYSPVEKFNPPSEQFYSPAMKFESSPEKFYSPAEKFNSPINNVIPELNYKPMMNQSMLQVQSSSKAEKLSDSPGKLSPSIPLNAIAKQSELDTSIRLSEINSHPESFKRKNTLPKIKQTYAETKTLEEIGNSHNVAKEAHVEQNRVALKSREDEYSGEKSISEEHDEKPSQTKMDPVMKNVYLGCCPYYELPPLAKKTVRIFVSSTFSDTKEERNALMQHVYPKLAEFCREKHGLEFQVVDMRWGVPEQASDNHSTTDLCIQEIQKCQDVSVGPCFVAILGNKYGFRPIPSDIEEHLFTNLQEVGTSISMTECDWDLVNEWYLRDGNALPIVYVLQPVSTKLPDVHCEDKIKQQEAWKKWETVNTSITQTLRNTAKKAHESGKITDEQRHIFFMSVTENEITHGILKNTADHLKETCLCIMRKIPDIDEHLMDPKAPKFIDLAKQNVVDSEAQQLLGTLRENKVPVRVDEGNLTQLEIEWSASGAKISLENIPDIDIAKEAHAAMLEDQQNIEKHKEYLDGICGEFFTRISRMIDAGGTKQSNLYTEVASEILQHFHLAQSRCEVFEGRDDIIAQAKDYLMGDCNVPMTIYGKSGCGKTSVMAKILENCCDKQWLGKRNKPFVAVARFLGTTPQTSNLYQLLDNLCGHLSILCGKQWETPDKFKDLIKSLLDLMTLVSTKQSIVLIIDSIDQLMPAYNAYKMTWLPEKLPRHVKIIVSTIPEGYPILDSMKELYEEKGGVFAEVQQLGDALGLKVIMKWLDLKKRTITEQQTVVVKQALEKCSLPLYARIAYDHIRKWRSFDTPTLEVLEVTVKGCINQLYESMEKKFGQPLVQHSLSYLTASRHGLSEVELEHLLSLDDVLLNKIYNFWKPPVRRIPPLLWTRVRSEISSYIVERSADDIIVIFWYHRQFIEATKERYLKDSSFSNAIHSNMVDYFLGKWGGGKAKPFEYTEAQRKRFGLANVKSSADRKLPLQPYIIQAKAERVHEVRINKRKLFELPFHLLKCKEFEILKQEIFFNFEWIYATLKGSSASTILDEMEIFMKADKQLRRDVELKILGANLRLIRPYISKFPDSLSYELSGRLAKYIGTSPYITNLLKQCDTSSNIYCPIIPMLTSFESADLGLEQNISYRSSEGWQEGGCIVCSKDFKIMYILDHDENGITNRLTSWDIESGEVLREIPILKERKGLGKADIYIQMVLDKTEQYIIAFHKGKFYAALNRERYFGNGMVDVIRLADGQVIRHISEYLHKEEFSNPLIWMTGNWMAIKFGPKNTLMHIYEDKRIDLNRPNVLSQDEQHFVLDMCHKTIIREFITKRDCGEFDQVGAVNSVTISKDKSIVLLAGPDFGEIRVYDLTKKSLNPDKQYGMLIKSKVKITIPNAERDKLANLMKSKEEIPQSFKTEMRVQFIISDDFGYAVGIYQNLEIWIAYLYCIFQGRRLGTYVAQIGPINERYLPYPQFSFDSKHVVVPTTTSIDIFSCETGEKTNSYEILQGFKDFHVSTVSDQVAVMTGKDIAVMTITKSEENSTKIKKGKKKATKSVTDLTFLPREELANDRIHNEFVISQTPDGAIIEEVEGAAHILDTDGLATARSKKKYAMDTKFTPNGQKVVQLHTRVQVIDIEQEEIKYTPQSGDNVTRTVISSNGTGVNEIIPIPTGVNRSEVLELIQSDRIVNENNKLKFRLTSAKNRTKIMSVPSIITVYEAPDAKMKKLTRFNVYQESIQAISNNFLVTLKSKSTGEYLNVYSLEIGRLMATHEMSGGFGCATFTLNEGLMISVDQNIVVKLFQGPVYTSCECKINALKTINEKWSVRGIHCSRPSSGHDVLENVVIFYKPLGTISSSWCYVFVDIIHRQPCEPLVLDNPLEDISKDGQIGIDSLLNIYNMKEGKIFTTVPYANRSRKMRLTVCLSDDYQNIVFIDKVDSTLNVAKKTESGEYVHLTTCFTHAPQIEFFGGLVLRCKGDVITIRSMSNYVIMLRLLGDNVKINMGYETEAERAIALVPDGPGLDTLIQQRQSDPTVRTLLNEKAQKEMVNLINTLSDEEFVDRFRLSKDTVNEVIDFLREDLTDKKDVGKKDSLAIHNQVLAALRVYATGNPEAKLDNSMSIAGSSMMHYAEKVSYALEKKQTRWINFSLTKQDVDQTMTQFKAIAQMPRVFGIVDGYHVKLLKFKENSVEIPTQYVNPAGYTSINVQLVCNAHNLFIDVFSHFKGTITDANMFKETKLNKTLDVAADNYQCVLLGDSNYPCLRYLMTPIKKAQTPQEEAYNQAHEKTMLTMKRTISLWKGRFPGVSLGLDLKPDAARAAIVATCMLHNFAIMKGESPLEESVIGEKQPVVNEDIPPSARGENVRKQIMQALKLK